MIFFSSGPNFRVLDYKVDKHLRPIKNQNVTMDGHELFSKMPDTSKSVEWVFFKVCKDGKFIGRYLRVLHFSRFLHHDNPYLKLGPFKEEQYSAMPYSVIFHDILSDTEINFLIEESRKNLTRTRTFDNTSGAFNKAEINSGTRRRVVHKTVQHWLEEVDFPVLTEDSNGKLKFKISKIVD